MDKQAQYSEIQIFQNRQASRSLNYRVSKVSRELITFLCPQTDEGTYGIRMHCLFQNIRGVSKSYKQKELRYYIINNNLKLGGIIETRVKENNCKIIHGKITANQVLHTNQQVTIMDEFGLHGTCLSIQYTYSRLMHKLYIARWIADTEIKLFTDSYIWA